MFADYCRIRMSMMNDRTRTPKNRYRRSPTTYNDVATEEPVIKGQDRRLANYLEDTTQYTDYQNQFVWKLT